MLTTEPKARRVIHVASGLLLGERAVPEVLMGLRGPNKPRPNMWELPGGKVEPGESPRQALAREWREELGVEINAGRFIATAFFELENDYHVELYVVHLSKTDTPPRMLDHVDLKYVDVHHAVRNLPCSPGLYAHYPYIRAYLESISR